MPIEFAITEVYLDDLPEQFLIIEPLLFLENVPKGFRGHEQTLDLSLQPGDF